MIDIPILGQKPAEKPALDYPELVSRSHVARKPGGMDVQVQLRHQKTHTFGDDDKYAAVDLRIARGVGLVLHQHYSGHLWEVGADSRQGIVTITISVLLGNWKWMIPIEDLTPQMVIKAGGEILERFNIPRSSLDLASFIGAKKKAVSRASQRPPGS